MIKAFISLIVGLVALVAIILTTIISLEIVGQVSEARAAKRRHEAFVVFLARVRDFIVQVRR